MERLQYFKRHGVNHICGYPPHPGERGYWSFDRWLSTHVKRSEWDMVHGFSKSSYQDIYTDGSGTQSVYRDYMFRDSTA